MTRIDQVLYTGKTRTTGGRDGTSRSDDGRLEIALSHFGGTGGGTNPEQLLAAGWSACFLSAIGIAAAKRKITLADHHADTEIDVGRTGDAYLLRARLNVSLPGIDTATAQSLVDEAHQTCPYSRATRGNIDVTIALI